MRSGLVIGTAFLFALCAGAFAQETPTRAETFQHISEVVAAATVESRELVESYSTADASWLEERVDDLIAMANDLSLWLSDNPYARVSGFTVSIPWGLSIDFVFVEANALSPVGGQPEEDQNQ
jgi:hypothetical protein